MFSLSSKKALSQRLTCVVKLLNPGEEVQIDYSSSTTGQDLLNEIASRLELPDKDYYGLKLHDKIHWIDSSKTIVKQTKGIDNVELDLHFKYYPAEPALLASEATRYYLYLQLRIDLLEGRLKTDDERSIAFLIACVLQSELGDYNLDPNNEDYGNYVSEFKFVPNQSEQLESKAMKLHQSEDFQGLKPADSELNFLKQASRFEMYGIYPFPVRDGNSRDHLIIGVNHLGISTFQNSQKVNQFLWADIERIALDNRLILIYCKKVDKKNSKIRPLFGFRCASQDHAQCFWKLATEHKYFFTLENTPVSPIVTSSGGLFRKTHKVRYSGRVEKDLLRNTKDDDNRRSPLKRSHSLMSKSFSERPQWQGFEQGKNLQSSLNNIYANDVINKTMPSNLGCFREEEEDDKLVSAGNDNQQTQPISATRGQSKKRSSIGSSTGNKKDNGTVFTGRKPNLMTKDEYHKTGGDHAKQYQSKVSSNHLQDFVNICTFLLTIISIVFVGILILDQKDRPSSINILINRANLEPVSKSLRDNLYQPVRAATSRLIAQIKAYY